MIYLITQKRYEIVKKFLSVCLDLQSTNYQTRGVFPTSFVEENGKLIGDYGQRSIGRITLSALLKIFKVTFQDLRSVGFQ